MSREANDFMWEPLSEQSLIDMVEEAELFMTSGCQRFWNHIKINHQKWRLSPEGDLGGGFWVVALIGNTCIYYNDIEDGFNISSYTTFGQIGNYYCNQSDLLQCVASLHLDFLREIHNDAETTP
jgi:hypothetical protein